MELGRGPQAGQFASGKLCYVIRYTSESPPNCHQIAPNCHLEMGQASDLPLEIYFQFIRQLSRLQDLSVCCLVNRAFYDLTAPVLYDWVFVPWWKERKEERVSRRDVVRGTHIYCHLGVECYLYSLEQSTTGWIRLEARWEPSQRSRSRFGAHK